MKEHNRVQKEEQVSSGVQRFRRPMLGPSQASTSRAEWETGPAISTHISGSGYRNHHPPPS